GRCVERVTDWAVLVCAGACDVHAGILRGDVERARREHGDADLLVHRECGCASSCMYWAAAGDVDAARTRVLSTEGMIEHARSSPNRSFVIATETGILHRLRREVPDAAKRFHAVSERAICRYMKRITLDKVLRALRDDVHHVTVPEPVAARARRALDRMVATG